LRTSKVLKASLLAGVPAAAFLGGTAVYLLKR
jgi:hypothetical protein